MERDLESTAMFESEYLSLGAEYLGVLNAKLRDLRGFSTLANELIQNADDAPNATSIIFDLYDDVLVVENDGVFSDCGHMEEDECPWSNDPKIGHFCDFHRFRRTASGDKRNEENTTGAFGIGFISVYQITDRPELISNGRHWHIDPTAAESRRVRQVRDTTVSGTQFRLPLAYDPDTKGRKALGVEAVKPEAIEGLLAELVASLPDSAVFLRKLEKIVLRRKGDDLLIIQRSVQGIRTGIRVENVSTGEVNTDEWYVFVGNFGAEAARIREIAPNQIESKRRSKVEVAVKKLGAGFAGKFHAFLPTLHRTGMPLHINADFYPATSRKELYFDDDYQGEWNRAAVRAAAEVLCEHITELRSVLTPASFWNLLRQARRVWDDRRVSDAPDDRLDAFWETLKRVLPKLAVVYTTQNEWLRPGQTVLLQNESEESGLIPFLERLGLNVVHLSLNAYQALLREVDVSYLGAVQLAEALRHNGFDEEFSEADMPSWFEHPTDWILLANEIAVLAGRSAKVKDEFGAVAIAMRSDGMYVAPNSLWRTDAETQAIFDHLFEEAVFASAENPEPIMKLVDEFTLEDAIDVLEECSVNWLTEVWRKERSAYLAILKWLAQRRAEAMRYVNRLRSLAIWPAGEDLHPLSELVMPGDFEDPLGLAAVLDGQVVERCRELLRDELGVEQLTLKTYLLDYLPWYFSDERQKKDRQTETQTYLVLIQLLSENLGRIRDDENVWSRLAGTALIACDDGRLRLPDEVYFDSPDVREILGTSAFYAKDLHRWLRVSNHDLFAWLGVHEHPQAADVVERIREITEGPPDHDERGKIQTIFEYLATQWKSTDTRRANEFAGLLKLAWLPAQADRANWHVPSTIYAIYQDYLFATQAHFLDFPRALQNNATEFLGFLEMPSVPTTLQIVRHLQRAVETPFDVNRQVYVVLNQRADDPEVDYLVNQRCLLLDGQGYVEPAKVFWSEHFFGSYRHRLDDVFLSYIALLKRLHVKDVPDVRDAVAVLKDISDEFAPSHRPLDEEAEQVLVRCWQMVAAAYFDDPDSIQDLFADLARAEVIPNALRVLRRPGDVYFVDRPRLAEKLASHLAEDLIPRPQDIWQAMTRAGVRPLSRAVRTDLVECVQPMPDPDLQERIVQRRRLIVRVMEAQRMTVWNRLVLDDIEVLCADQLRLRYSLPNFDGRLPAPVDDVTSYLCPSPRSLYYVAVRDAIPWSAVARELAYALSPESDAGQIAPGLKVVLSATSSDQAELDLDEMGFAPLQSIEGIGVARGQTVTLGGTFSEDDGDAWMETREDEDAGASPEVTNDKYDSDEIGFDDEAGSSVSGDFGAEVDSGDATCVDRQNEQGAASAADQTVEETAPNPEPDGRPEIDGAGQRHSGVSQKAGRAATGQSHGIQRTHETPRRQSGRFRTYVSHEHLEDNDADSGNNQHLSEIDRAGVKRVLAHERDAGRTPNEMPHTHPGYDVESCDDAGNILRKIEIKSMPDQWGDLGAGLSDTQFATAQAEGDRFWLYIVERALTDDVRIYRIQDPANRVTQFFYDDGWRDLAESDEQAPVARRSILNPKSAIQQKA